MATEQTEQQIYLGLMVGVRASLGLNFADFQYFCSILSLFMGILCIFVTFRSPSLGLTK